MPERKNAENLFVKTLKWTAGKLGDLDIEYMITGGSAVGFWGHIRTTMDIDMVITLDRARVDKFFSEFEKEAHIDKDDIISALCGKKMFNAIYNETLFKIDFIPLKADDAYQSESFRRRKKVDFGDFAIWVISPEDLIVSKLEWTKAAGGSERQMADCRSVLLMNENLDAGYIDKWTHWLGINDLWKDLKKSADTRIR